MTNQSAETNAVQRPVATDIVWWACPDAAVLALHYAACKTALTDITESRATDVDPAEDREGYSGRPEIQCR